MKRMYIIFLRHVPPKNVNFLGTCSKFCQERAKHLGYASSLLYNTKYWRVYSGKVIINNEEVAYRKTVNRIYFK